MNCSNKFSVIDKQIEKHRLSHAFLLETNNIDLCYNDLKLIIKKINCTSESYTDNCSKCNLCKLIDLNNLPSFLTIRPDGMNIKRQQVEEIESKFSTKPVYSKFNIYSILEADKMNESAENTILKFLEEPEDNIIGFLITTNKEKILPTIKSRCEYCLINYEDTNLVDQELNGFINNYLDKIVNTSDYLINKTFFLTKYSTREDIEKVFNQMLLLKTKELENNLSNKKIIIKQLEIIEKCLKQIKYNVNLELILDYFVLEMRRVND
jgi:DNA polymerase III subunit delta'